MPSINPYLDLWHELMEMLYYQFTVKKEGKTVFVAGIHEYKDEYCYKATQQTSRCTKEGLNNFF